MPRLRLIEGVPLQCPDPVAALDEMFGSHSFTRIAKATLLCRRTDDETGEMSFVLIYGTAPLLTFTKEGFVVDFGGCASPSAIARCNAALSLYAMYIQRERNGHLSIREAGGHGIPLPVDRPAFIPYLPTVDAEEDDRAVRCG